MDMSAIVRSWYPPCGHAREQSELTHAPGGFKMLCLDKALTNPCMQRGPLIRQGQLEALLMEVAADG